MSQPPTAYDDPDTPDPLEEAGERTAAAVSTLSTMIDERIEALDEQLAFHNERANPWRANPERVRIIYGEGRYVDMANGEVDGVPVSQLSQERYLEVLDSNRQLAKQFEREPAYHEALSQARAQVSDARDQVTSLNQERERTLDYRNQLPEMADNLALMYEALEDPDVRAELERTGRLDQVLRSAPLAEDFEPLGTSDGPGAGAPAAASTRAHFRPGSNRKRPQG